MKRDVSFFKKGFLFLTGFLIVFCFSTVVYAQFSSDVLVNDDATAYNQYIRNGTPSIAIHENTVYSTWFDARADGGVDGHDVYFAKGTVDTTGKIIFGTNVKVNDVAQSATGAHTGYPSIAVSSDGTIFIVWTDGRNDEDDIYLARSTDGGTSFLANQQIDILPSTEAYRNRRSPRVAAADGYVYVTFGKGLHESLEINISSDNGATFGTAIEITSGTADESVIAADGSYVYIAHISSGDVMLNISPDHGQTFSPSVMINDAVADILQADVSIAASGSNLYVVWYDERKVTAGNSGYAVYGAFSADRGATFGLNVLLSHPDAGTTSSDDDRKAPSIAASGDNVAVSFHGVLNETQSVISMISTDKGATWTDEIMVSDTFSRPSIGPSSIAVNSSMACVIWVANGDYAGDADTGDNIYASGYIFGTQSNCPSGVPVFNSSNAVLTLPSVCVDGIYYESEVKIFLDFNTMTFQLK